MVTMRLPATAPTLVRQLLVGVPSIEHGAGGALTFAAAVLGAGEVEVVAEHAQERAIGIGVDVAARSVDIQFGDPRHINILWLKSTSTG